MIRAKGRNKRGQLLAALLAGAWREETVATDCSLEEIELLTPLLIETGAAALAWRRVRHSALESSRPARPLQETYKLYKLLALVYEREVADVFRLLRAHNVEPVMVKGWVASRNYAEEDARHCGDIDLCVTKEEHARATEALRERTDFTYEVDLHTELHRIDEADFDEVKERSILLQMEDEKIRVPCPEDHLRVLCYHFLREGAWRSVWLCDIAAALEARPAKFDWNVCLGSKPPVDDWLACTLGLAHRLLGADLSDTPVAERAKKLPRWFVPSVLRQWEERSYHRRQQTPVVEIARAPLLTLRELRYHWPSPVEASISLRASFNRLPRLPLQTADLLARAGRLLVRLPGLLRQSEHRV